MVRLIRTALLVMAVAFAARAMTIGTNVWQIGWTGWEIVFAQRTAIADEMQNMRCPGRNAGSQGTTVTMRLFDKRRLYE